MNNLLHSSQVVDAADLRYSNMSINCYNLIRVYLNKFDVDTKCTALRALRGTLCGRPKLMLVSEQLGLIDELMQDHVDIRVQRQALDCWYDILESQEKKTEISNQKEAAKMAGSGRMGGFSSPGKTVSQIVSGDQDSDACLSGGVLTSKASYFYDFCMHKDPGLRMSALRLIGKLLRQGLINPNDAIPYLLCLQGDTGDGGVRREAFYLLSVEGEKRPEMLRQRVRRGIELGMVLQLKLGSNFSPVMHLPGGVVESVFGRVYAECVRGDKGLRQNLFRSLLNIFVDAEAAEGEEGEGDVKLLQNYVGSTLAHLPFVAVNEVLNIIHQIDSIVAVDGNQLVDALIKSAKGLGWSEGEDEAGQGEESNTGEVGEEGLKNLFALDWSAEEGRAVLAGWSQLLVKSDAVVILLRLKYFLKQVYGIGDNKIEEYNPSEQTRSTPLNLPDVMPIFDVLQASTKGGGGGPVARDEEVTTGNDEADDLCWKFVNFRRLMCEYVEDYDLTRAATKVVVKKEAPGARSANAATDDDDDLSDVDLEDDEFDDDEPLFLQKQKKGGGKAEASKASGRKRAASRKHVDEDGEEEDEGEGGGKRQKVGGEEVVGQRVSVG